MSRALVKSLSESQSKGIVRSELYIRKRELKLAASKEVFDTIKALGVTILSNPVTCGLSALMINQLAYKLGFYDISEEEAAQTSILGGPVWFTLGPSQSAKSVASSRASTVAGFIVAASAAWAAGKAASSINLGDIAAIAGAVK